MAAVKQRSGNLENASNRLRDDIEIVVAALNHDVNNLATVKRLANMFALKEYQPMLGTLEEYEDVIIKLCQ